MLARHGQTCLQQAKGKTMPLPFPGLILAGGQSSRMGQTDKMLLPLAGQSLLERVIERTRPQADPLVLNANGDPARFAACGLPVIADPLPDFAGPLAGILAGLEWARTNRPEASHILSIASDSPLFPADLASRLWQALDRDQADIAIAASAMAPDDIRDQPVFGLWPVAQADALRHALVHDDLRKMGLWLDQHKTARAIWPVQGWNDPFANVNTPEDLRRLDLILTGRMSDVPPQRAQWDLPDFPGLPLVVSAADLPALRDALIANAPRLVRQGHQMAIVAVCETAESWPVPAAVLEGLLDFAARHPVDKPAKKRRAR